MAPGHYSVWPFSGIFFVALGVVQVAWAGFAVWRPGSLALWSGVAINVGSAVMWGITRTPVGQPFGPQAGDQLPIGSAGILTLVLEALVVGFLVATRFVRPAVTTSAAVLVSAPQRLSR